MSGQFLAAATALFASLLVLGLVVAGLTLMVAPETGRAILKVLGISTAFFIFGSFLLQALWHASGEIGSFAQVIGRLVGFAAATALVGCAFLYPFNQRAALNWLKRAGLVLAGLLVLPELAAGLARAMRPAVFGVFLLAVSVAAYCLREYRKPRPQSPRRTNRPERTPGLPRGRSRI
jgi:hypothetical protein